MNILTHKYTGITLRGTFLASFILKQIHRYKRQVGTDYVITGQLTLGQLASNHVI